MFCLKCGQPFSKCKCPDLEARLDEAVKAGRFVYKYCRKCGKHYARCRCEKPEWWVKGADPSILN